MDLNGKVINFLGDSITEGVGTSAACCRYDSRAAEMLGAKNNNYGVSGTRLAYQTFPGEKPQHDLYFLGRAYRMDTNADMVVVYGGVNDYIHGDAYFGTLEDTTVLTFCGAVYKLMTYLKEAYPDKPIVFMTPAHMYFRENTDRLPSPRVEKRDARRLQEYVDVIKARGKEFGIPVLDLFEKLPIDPNDQADYDKYTVDGLHFNDLGHEVLANTLVDFLKSL